MTKLVCVWMVRLWVVLLLPCAQASDTDKLDKILDELQKIRSTLQQMQTQNERPVFTTKLDVDKRPFIGSAEAAVAVVMFTDVECIYCKQFYEQTLPHLKRLFVETGKVRFYSLDLPGGKHSSAFMSAQAGRCAEVQGQFWPIRERMHANDKANDKASVEEFAADLGLDIPTFRQCIEGEQFKDAVMNDVLMATAAGVEGTPAFVIGKNTGGSIEGEVITGAMPLGIFQAKIKKLLQ